MCVWQHERLWIKVGTILSLIVIVIRYVHILLVGWERYMHEQQRCMSCWMDTLFCKDLAHIPSTEEKDWFKIVV